ncbi:MAG TPA: PKD domain-containing protein, partial [Bacteroidales bacterium]|nr:PKD domain-containing protein [Bacteroidales bacterium]
TTNNSNITSWDWDFGDPQSGSYNHSNLESPSHVFSSAGTSTIMLTATTVDGCVGASGKDVSFSPRPSGSFRAENDCFSEGKPTVFTSEMQPVSSISNYKWTFYLPGDRKETVTGGSEVSFLLDSSGEYDVELFAESDPGCSASVIKTIYLKPTVVLSDMNYLAGFKEGNAAWMPEGGISGDNSAWTYGNPGFQGQEGDTSSAWYVTGNPIRAGVQSDLSSPCFNLKKLDRPMIELGVFRNLEKDHDGIVLQASADNGPWMNVGGVDDGINWYNSDHIGSNPGGQSAGWTGDDSSGADTAWVTARHDLNDMAGNGLVRFRLSFARDTAGSTGHTAFALDRVVIRNRTQNVLLEHFTNGSDDNCRTVNARVNSIFHEHYHDLVKLEYHTDFPGYDPFFEQNPAVPATRTLYYGITTVPYSVLEGGADEGLKFDYSNTGELSGRDVVLESLADPEFDIRLKVSREQEKITADVTVTALGDIAANERILQVAVFEKLITRVSTGNGETAFLNVVKALLPNAAGTAIFTSWTKGESRHFIFSWNVENVYDPKMIRVAAFLQNDNTRQVYQAATDDSTNISTGRTDYDNSLPGMTIYPNPTEEGRVNISLKEPAMDDYHVEIIDQTGRLVKYTDWHRGDTSQTIELPGLRAGIYTVMVKGNSGTILDYRKLVIIR